MMLLDFLERLSETQTVEDVWAMTVEEMGKVGFDQLLYGFTRFRTGNSFGDQQDLLILSNLDESYVKQFLDDGMYDSGPMVQWAAANVGACSWSWIADHMDSLTPAEKKIVEFNHRYNLTAGYTISFKDVSYRAKGAIGMSSGNGKSQAELDEVWREHGRTLIQMCNMAHLKLTQLPFSGTRKTLTSRQKEALEWVADGKTTQDIATIMGLTAATVEKHLRLARNVLDVDTTAQAILKASFQNQIFVIAV
jgi:LuxR family transcriptional regulator